MAALILTFVLALIFFLPLVYVGSKVVGQASNAFDYVQGLLEKGVGAPPLWLKGLPLVGDKLEGMWQEIGQDTPKLIEVIKPHIKSVLGSMVSAGAGMARVFLLTILSLFFLFFLLKEGRSIRNSLEKMALRLGGEKGRHLLFVAGATMRSLVYGILGAAIVQGIMAIVGLWISGVPSHVAVIMRRSNQLNGVTGLCVTKLDVLDGLDTIRICTSYRHEGKTRATPPSGAEALAKCEPVYEEVPGWTESTLGVRSFDKLPVNAQKYLKNIEECTEARIDIISTGAERDDTIFLRHPFE